MKRAVLASIKPRHTVNIKTGKKTLEVRKTVPDLFCPFKVYVYETKDGGKGAGAVVCEFVCDYIAFIQNLFDGSISQEDCKAACLTEREILDYAAEKTVYGWHISELKVYDEPKDLQDFRQCHKCPYGDLQNCLQHEYSCDGAYAITRPPQSWCYAEEVP